MLSQQHEGETHDCPSTVTWAPRVTCFPGPPGPTTKSVWTTQPLSRVSLAPAVLRLPAVEAPASVQIFQVPLMRVTVSPRYLSLSTCSCKLPICSFRTLPAGTNYHTILPALRHPHHSPDGQPGTLPPAGQREGNEEASKAPCSGPDACDS